jgi:hypothetical protein
MLIQQAQMLCWRVELTPQELCSKLMPITHIAQRCKVLQATLMFNKAHEVFLVVLAAAHQLARMIFHQFSHQEHTLHLRRLLKICTVAARLIITLAAITLVQYKT